jgi:predicted ATPase
MLESIGDFAAERLTRAGEALELRARHAGYFQTFANRMDAALRPGERGGARSRCSRPASTTCAPPCGRLWPSAPGAGR